MFSNNVFRRVMDCIPTPILILDENNNIVYNNKKSNTWLRYAKIRLDDKHIEHLWDSFLVQDDITKCQLALDKLRGAIKNNTNMTIRLEVTTKDLNKAYYIILTTASNITLDGQSFILITLEDITYLKERERQLKQSQTILTTIIANTTDVLFNNAKIMQDNTDRINEQTDFLKQQIQE